MFILNPYDSGLHRYTRAILAKADLEGFVKPNTATIKAMDKMIRQLDSQGIWDRMDIFYFARYNDVNLGNFSRINWINPSAHSLSSASTSLYNINGWKFDGSTAIGTNFRTQDAVKLTLNNAHQSALIYDVSDASSAVESIIAGNDTNGIDRWSAWNTNLQRINANTSLSSNADLSGVGFKTINRKSATDVVLTSGATSLSRTGNSNALQSLSHNIGANSTNRSKLGISTFSMGSAIDDKVSDLRTLYNTFFTEIGLSAIA